MSADVRVFRRKVMCHWEDEREPTPITFDQRDVCAIERQRGRGAAEIPGVELLRWCTYNAGRRTKAIQMDYEAFENACVMVEPLEDEAEVPTQPVPGDD